MKKIFVSMVLVLFSGISIINAQQNWQSFSGSSGNAVLNVEGDGKVRWNSTALDFGNIKQNEPKTAEFLLTNTGKVPIIITNIQTSCGCTKAKYPVEPILPGKNATISTTYDAATLGTFNKTLTISFKADDNLTQVLEIKGVVVKDLSEIKPDNKKDTKSEKKLDNKTNIKSEKKK